MGQNVIYAIAKIKFDKHSPQTTHVIRFHKNNPAFIDIAFKNDERRHTSKNNLLKFKILKKIKF